MKLDERTNDAVQRMAGTPEGRVFVEFLRSQLEVDKDALIMAEHPEQVRRLQGVARRMREILSLFDRK